MINGYEELYLEPRLYGGDKPPKYYVMRSEQSGKLDYGGTRKMAHRVCDGGWRENKATGLQPFHAYLNMVEQQIGPEVYDKLIKNKRNYLVAMRYLLRHQDDVKTYKRHLGAIKDCEGMISELSNDIKAFSSKLEGCSDLELDALKNSIDQLKIIRQKKEELEQYLKPVKTDTVKHYLNSLKNACQDVYQNEDAIKRGLSKFNNPAFEAELEQDYVDTMLLPSQEKEEKYVRMDAKAKYAMCDLDRESLVRASQYAAELCDWIKENGIETPLPEELKAKYNLVCGLDEMSTVQIEEATLSWLDKQNTAFAKSYVDIADKLKSSDYGKSLRAPGDPFYKIINENGVRTHHSVNPIVDTIKHGFNSLIGKDKTDQYWFMELESIVEGANETRYAQIELEMLGHKKENQTTEEMSK